VSTVVAKIGSSSITDERGAILNSAIEKLCDEVVAVRAGGHRVVVVSSGAIAAGVGALDPAARPTDLPTLQAMAAVGQSRLMQVYNDAFAAHGVIGAQLLLMPHDFVSRRQYLHARGTLSRLLELGCVPVVNENDAIADEIRWGDNDRIAALVAHSLAADVLVLLTDIVGLHTADPRRDPEARLVERVAADDPLLETQVRGAGSARGSGGMASKLTAARIASWSGVRTVIADAARPGVVAEAVAGVAGVGTTFEPHDRKLSARKLWIAFASATSGAIVVDDGARLALTERNTSLLPAGVRDVVGDFDDGDVVDVVGPDGSVFARGMVAVDATTLRQIAGHRTRDLPDHVPHETVHRDDLVMLPG
jgi:glutamate 5-kinase